MSQIPESPITIVKEVVLEFLNYMLQEKSVLEHQIREKSEEIRSEFAAMGQSSYTFADVDKLSKNYKEFFVNFYKNIAHLRVVATAAHQIRIGIEKGFAQGDIVKSEVLQEFQNLQSLVSDKNAQVADYAGMQEQMINQTENISDYAIENSKILEEMESTKAALREKETELENLTQGMMQMENQLNGLGAQMLETHTEREDMQSALAERDIEIARLKGTASDNSEYIQEIESLKQRIQEMSERERDLVGKKSNASNEYIEKLQDDLESTRNELYAMKSKQVEKNEEMRKMKFEVDEASIKLKQSESISEESVSKLRHVESDLKILKDENNKFTVDLTSVQTNFDKVKSENDLNTKSLKESQEKVVKYETELKNYEGKISVSKEERDAYDTSLEYFQEILIYDPKFRALAVLESLNTEIQLSDLSKSLGLPSDIVHRSIVELADSGMINVRRDGSLVFVQVNEDRKSPFSLEHLMGIN